VFNNSSEVLKVFKPHFYDLVILDIAMPDMDGFDRDQSIKKLDSDVKVCLLTATGYIIHGNQKLYYPFSFMPVLF
jgi:CheY-like chemotaxis protein